MKLLMVGLVGSSLLLADFRYEQTTRITKGMVTKMPFGKKPEPEATTNYLKGSRMAAVSKTSTTVFDFEKQTFTTLMHDKKQYWESTFEEMRQALENAQAEMNKATKGQDVSLEMKFDAKATGVEKEVGGVPAKQMIFTIEPKATDGKQNATVGTKIVSDSWMSEAVPGYGEYRAFHDRMKDKATWLGMANPMAQMNQQRGMAEAMKKMAEEMSKTPGLPVLTITRITMPGMNLDFSSMRTGPDGQPQQVDAGEAAKEAAGNAGGSAAGRAIGGPVGGMLGGALGGRLGGFGRKKKEEAPKAEPAPTPTPAATASGEGSLMMESFTEASGFSSEPIAENVFQVPTGYSRIDSPFVKMRKR